MNDCESSGRNTVSSRPTVSSCAQPRPKASAVAWSALGLAVCGEVAGALLLRISDGFTRPLPTLAAVSAFGMALFLVSRVMKSLPVSIAYPIWAGGGTAGVALFGTLIYGESLNAWAVLGVVLVIAGVVVLNSSGEKTSGC
jgi:small multidrug resistance pump